MWQIGPAKIEGPFVLAAMLRYTVAPARRLARSFGAALVSTEMMIARGIVKGAPLYRRKASFDPCEQPIAAQIAANEPESAVQAAKILADMGFMIVDINMACPAFKVTQRLMGGGLLKHCDLALRITEAVSRCAKAVTVKLRLGFSPQEPIEPGFIGRLADAGAQAVTIHGRYVSQVFSGRADWKRIGELASASPIPVIGSGDVETAADALRMLRELPVTAVAFARGAVGKPWVFAEARELLAGRQPHPPGCEQLRRIASNYFDEIRRFPWPAYCIAVARRTLPDFLAHLPLNRSMLRELSKVKTLGDLDLWAVRWGIAA